MKKSYYLIVLFLVTLIAACSTRSGNDAEDNNTPEKANKKWTKEAQLQYKVLAYYYNNNIHDSLVMKVPEVLDFCREHELWADYYDTWMLLGQEYNFSGETNMAIKGRPLFIYTDGLNEAENRQLKQFGNERLLSILRNTHFESSQQVIETLAAEVKEHRNGAEPNDDLTMMCIRVE